jgi:hypothetical protein
MTACVDAGLHSPPEACSPASCGEASCERDPRTAGSGGGGNRARAPGNGWARSRSPSTRRTPRAGGSSPRRPTGPPASSGRRDVLVALPRRLRARLVDRGDALRRARRSALLGLHRRTAPGARRTRDARS